MTTEAESERTAFERSFRQLSRDHGAGIKTTLVVGFAVFFAWFGWATLARVSVYASSSSARLELDAATFPIESPFVGRVVKSTLRMGQAVQRGDVLIELDGVSQQLQMREAQIREGGYAPQILQLRAQVVAEREARKQEQRAAAVAAQEAESRTRQSEIAEVSAKREASRVRLLYADRLVSERALEVAETAERSFDAALTTARSAARRIHEEQTTRDRERDVRVQRLGGDIAALQAQQQNVRAETDRLNAEVERRLIRAAASGQIAEARTLREGAVLAEGERLGTIVPNDRRLFLAAQFPADVAFGRIRSGQPAVLRLDGFPWAEYGTVPALVSRVAQETRDGGVRVEFELQPAPLLRAPLAHGMPGRVEVVVERLSPLGLLSRTAGQWLTEVP